jgi:hypothetical protein
VLFDGLKKESTAIAYIPMLPRESFCEVLLLDQQQLSLTHAGADLQSLDYLTGNADNSLKDKSMLDRMITIQLLRNCLNFVFVSYFE